MIPSDLERTELVVVAWTDHYFGDDYVRPLKIACDDGRDIELDFTTDRRRADEADALWFHGPSIRELPPKRPDQKWVLMSMESDVNYPPLKSPLLARTFDLIMTYRLDSDVPCPYPNWRDYGTFLEPPPPFVAQEDGPMAVYIASNPVAHRDRYVRELMRYVPIDSLGACLNNKSLDDFVAGTGWAPGGWSSILDVVRRYKFYLALENSMTTDYVTERVFHALVCGVVPVYLGAPNVRDFLPHANAALLASECDSPRELAMTMRRLADDEEAYRAHLGWKDSGYSPAFQRLVDLGSIDPRRRMAVKLAHGCDRSCSCGGRMHPPGPRP